MLNECFNKYDISVKSLVTCYQVKFFIVLLQKK